MLCCMSVNVTCLLNKHINLTEDNLVSIRLEDKQQKTCFIEAEKGDLYSLRSLHTLPSSVNGDEQLWEERGNANMTADISHGFHSLQQLTSSHSLHLCPLQLHTSFDRLVEKKKRFTEYGSRKKTRSSGRHSFLNLLGTPKKNLSDFSTLLKALLFFCGLQRGLKTEDQFLPSIYYQQGTIHY